MPVATMEELDAIEVGQQVRVANPRLGIQEWTRHAEGFERDGVVVSLPNFVGAVNEGQVSRADAPLFTVGEWRYHPDYGDHRYAYLVLAVLDDGTVRLAQFRSGRYVNITAHTQMTHLRYPLVTELEPWMGVAAQLAVLLDEARQETRTTPALPEGLVNDLQNFAADAEDDDLDGILIRHGIDIDRDITVTVRIAGSTDWIPETYRAREWLGEAFSVSEVDDSVTVYWNREVTLTKRGRGCQCDDISNDDVEGYLPARHDEWDFQVQTCSAH